MEHPRLQVGKQITQLLKSTEDKGKLVRTCAQKIEEAIDQEARRDNTRAIFTLTAYQWQTAGTGLLIAMQKTHSLDDIRSAAATLSEASHKAVQQIKSKPISQAVTPENTLRMKVETAFIEGGIKEIEALAAKDTEAAKGARTNTVQLVDIVRDDFFRSRGDQGPQR